MRRRLVWIQGKTESPLKILLERFDGGTLGYYVGGWGEPVFVTGFSDETYTTIELLGITATGPGTNDWLVGGIAFNDDVSAIVFYNSTGRIFESVQANLFAYGVGGHFATARTETIDTTTPFSYRHAWSTATGSEGEDVFLGGFNYGYVLPDVYVGNRLAPGIGRLRNRVLPNLDLSYSVFVGNAPASGGTSGNPWLVNASGSFIRLDTDLNSIIPNSDLIGLTLYHYGVDFNGLSPWTAGDNTLSVTPWTITTGGVCAEGTAFPVAFVGPDNAGDNFFAWDASLWVT